MPRRPRIEVPGGIHHVTCRGNRRQRVFRDDGDRRMFLAELHRTVVGAGWNCLTYCLMDNHLHAVLETPQQNLGRGMRDLLSRFVLRCNARHETCGHMFQERFHSVLVVRDEHFAHLLRYVATNPVNAGMCARPEDWRWSSHTEMLARRESALVAVRRVDELLAPWGGPAHQRYAALLAPEGRWGSWKDAAEPRPAFEQLRESMPLEEAIRAARACGYRISEIADLTGLSVPTVSRRARGV